MKNWAVYLAIIIGAGIYNASTTADRDSSGAIVDSGNVDAFQLRMGDCFNNSGAAYDGSEVSSLAGVPCSEPHDNEVYAVMNVTGSNFPGEDEMWDMAIDKCLGRFESFVGRDYESSSLDIVSLYPTKDSWNLQNDREVVCALYHVEREKLTGSAKGKGI